MLSEIQYLNQIDRKANLSFKEDREAAIDGICDKAIREEVLEGFAEISHFELHYPDETVTLGSLVTRPDPRTIEIKHGPLAVVRFKAEIFHCKIRFETSVSVEGTKNSKDEKKLSVSQARAKLIKYFYSLFSKYQT